MKVLSGLILLLAVFKCSRSDETTNGTCPQPTETGSISHAFGFKDKLRETMINCCKKSSSITDDWVKELKTECLDKEVMPCVPDPVKDLFEKCIVQEGCLSANKMCDVGVQDNAIKCVNQLFAEKKTKDEWMSMLKDNVDMVCDRLDAFKKCFDGYVDKLDA